MCQRISKGILFLSFMSFSTLLWSSPIPFFFDPNLQECLDEHVADNGWTQAEDISFLNCENRNIVDINNLDALLNLNVLILSDNNLTNLVPLFNLNQLTTLNLSGNRNLNFVPEVHSVLLNNPNLEVIGLGGINIDDPNLLDLFNPQTGQAYQLTTLDISATGIADLNFLSVYPDLEALNVSDNGIQFLPSFIGSLTNLHELDASGNQLIDVFGLANLTQLRILNLSGNSNLNFVPDVHSVLLNNPNLEVIGLNGISIADSNSLDLFNPQTGQPYQLTELNIGGTGVMDLNFLNAYPNLEVFDISDNGIVLLSPFVGNLTNLREFDASGNQLVEVFSLINLTQLTTLNLSGNSNLNFIPEVHSILLNNPNLEVIGLSGISIDDPNLLDLFNPQIGQPYALVELDIGGTGVMDLNFLNTYQDLEVLNISNNGIQFLPPFLGNLTNLREFNAGGNQLVEVFSLMNLTQLTTLNLSGNSNLDFMPDVHSILLNNPNLEVIGLNGISIPDSNLLDLFNPQTGQAYKLVELDIGSTGVTDLNFLNAYQNLEVLDISDNDIQFLQNFSGNLSNLRELDASGNQLLDIFALMNLTQLTTLNLSGNSDLNFIPEVHSILLNNPNLEVIGLNGISISDSNSLDLFNPQTGQAYKLVELDIGSTGVTDLNFLNAYLNLEVLDISDNGIQFLPPFLGNLTNLREFDASGNQLVEVFSLINLTQLTTLNLSGNNNLNFIPEVHSILLNNPNLEVIGLSGISIDDPNLLDLFNPQIGQPYALVELDIGGTGVMDLNFLNAYQDLEVLNISNNGIQFLPPFLGNLTNLREFNAGGNQLVEVFSLMNLTQLTTLNLSGNSDLNFIPEVHSILLNNPNLEVIGLNGISISDSNSLDLFNPQTGQAYKLVELDIGSTGVTDLNFLNAYQNLEVLDISDNDIQFLQNFSGNLSNLRELDASGNQLVDVFTLANLTQLRKLNLSGNSNLNFVPDVHSVLLNNPNLEVIGLNGITIHDSNLLDLFNPQTSQAYNLVELNIGSTGVTNLDFLNAYQDLEVLNISNNGIQFLPPSIGNLTKLRELDASGNQLVDLFALTNQTQLRSLNLSGNGSLNFVPDVHSVLLNNPNLEVIGLNGISILDSNLLDLFNPQTGQAYKLVELDIGSTGVTNLDFLNAYTNLEVLNISNNGIQFLPPSISTLTKLREFDASGNQLADVFSLINLTQLTTLHLSGNSNLGFVPEVHSILLTNPNLEIIGLGGITIPDSSLLDLFNLQTGQAYNLVELDISNTGVMDLNFLASYLELKKLKLAGNSLSDISLIASLLPQVETLDLSDNQIVDVFPLTTLQNILTLDLSDNQIVQTAPLAALTQLQKLDLLGNNQANCEELDFLETIFENNVVTRPTNCVTGTFPELSILSPQEAAVFTTNDLIQLAASVIDAEEGDISASVVWSSDLDGILGTNGSLQVQLSGGAHLITASITDSDGNATSQSISISVDLVYCPSAATRTRNEWIDEIAIGSFTNPSGPNSGYGDFTDAPAINISQGVNSISLTPGFRSRTRNENWRVWIDSNRDGTFDSSELVFSGRSRNTITGEFQLPAGALSGETGMRISMRRRYTPPSCGTFTRGEVEDYKVIIE